MKEFNEIKQLAASVAEKRTHVRKAFQKLLETLTAPVADVTSDEQEVSAKLYSKTDTNVYDERDVKTTTYYLDLRFKGDAYFVISCEVDVYGYPYPEERRVYIEDEEPADLRKMAEKIPEALQSIRDQLRERTNGYDETIKLLEGMIGNLES